MKLHIKFSLVIWIALFSVLLFTHYATAVESRILFSCDGEQVYVYPDGKKSATMEVVRERGVWMQAGSRPLPGAATVFYNLDNGEVAKIGKNYTGFYYVEFYKNADYYAASKPYRALRCRQQ